MRMYRIEIQKTHEVIVSVDDLAQAEQIGKQIVAQNDNSKLLSITPVETQKVEETARRG